MRLSAISDEWAYNGFLAGLLHLKPIQRAVCQPHSKPRTSQGLPGYYFFLWGCARSVGDKIIRSKHNSFNLLPKVFGTALETSSSGSIISVVMSTLGPANTPSLHPFPIVFLRPPLQTRLTEKGRSVVGVIIFEGEDSAWRGTSKCCCSRGALCCEIPYLQVAPVPAATRFEPTRHCIPQEAAFAVPIVRRRCQTSDFLRHSVHKTCWQKGPTYLLRLHGTIIVHSRHLAVHRSLRLAICCLLGRNLGRIHGLAVVCLAHQRVAWHGVVCCCHGVLVIGRLDMLAGHCLWSTLRARRATRLSLGVRCGFLTRHYVDEEVEHVGFGQSGGNIASLQGTSFVLLCMNPRAHRQLGDENVTAFGKEDRRLCRDHLDFWVGLHDLLYPCEGQLVQLVVVGIALEMVDSLLPVGREDVLVLPVEALVNVRPWTSVQLSRRIPLLRELRIQSAEVSEKLSSTGGFGRGVPGRRKRSKQTAALAPICMVARLASGWSHKMETEFHVAYHSVLHDWYRTQACLVAVAPAVDSEWDPWWQWQCVKEWIRAQTRGANEEVRLVGWAQMAIWSWITQRAGRGRLGENRAFKCCVAQRKRIVSPEQFENGNKMPHGALL